MPLRLEPGHLFDQMSKKSNTVLASAEAEKRTDREIHIGFANAMPDSAYIDTAMQFLLPLHLASGGVHIVPHFIEVEGIERSEAMQRYITATSKSIEEVKEHGLDAMIVTGANLPRGGHIKDTKFYQSMQPIIEFAHSDTGPTSTLYSCMASHVYMQSVYGEERSPLNEKRWGVYHHKVRDPSHPLTHGMDTMFDIPHSRWNEVHEDQFTRNGLHVLVASEEAGVHMATSPDGLRSVLWQGHPEYYTKSLYGEFQRDLGLWIEEREKNNGSIDRSITPLPQHYLHGTGLSLVEEFRKKVQNDPFYASTTQGRLPYEAYSKVIDETPNRWTSSNRALLSNWLAAVKDITHKDVGKPFMDGVNRDDVFHRNPQMSVSGPE